jgi:hypothetical protein
MESAIARFGGAVVGEGFAFLELEVPAGEVFVEPFEARHSKGRGRLLDFFLFLLHNPS